MRAVNYFFLAAFLAVFLGGFLDAFLVTMEVSPQLKCTAGRGFICHAPGLS
jgi:hypothetical protein